MLNIAIVGAGGMGRTHIENIRQMPDTRICGICDPAPEAAALAADLSAKHFVSIDALLADAEADALIICTPTFLHVEQVRLALAAGKHCISEKPLCLSSAEGRELFALAERSGVQLYVGQVLRFFEEYELAADIMQSGQYGKLIDAYLYRLTARPDWQKGNWLFDKAKSGLIPFDLHIHDLDFMVSVLGKPKDCVVQRGSAGKHMHADYYRILYRFGDVTVCSEATWYEAPIPFTQGYRLYLERAIVLYDGATCTVYEPGKAPRRLTGAEKENQSATCINVMPTNAYYREMEHFLDCIRRNAPSHRITGEQIISVLEVLEALDSFS